MVTHIDDSLSANHAINAAYGERTVKVVGCLGIEIIDFNLSRAMNILAITQVQAHVSYATGLAVAKE